LNILQDLTLPIAGKFAQPRRVRHEYNQCGSINPSGSRVSRDEISHDFRPVVHELPGPDVFIKAARFQDFVNEIFYGIAAFRRGWYVRNPKM